MDDRLVESLDKFISVTRVRLLIPECVKEMKVIGSLSYVKLCTRLLRCVYVALFCGELAGVIV